MPGPVGFRGGSDSISSIQGGAESLLGGGEVRPFSPGYDPSVDPGAGLWRDPNAATESDSPFGLDDACEDGAPDPEFDQGGEFALDDVWWKEVAPTGGPTGPIPISQVTGLIAALATKVAQTAFDLIVADLEQRLTAVEAGGGGGGGGVTTGQVDAAIAAALAPLITDIGNLTTGLTGKQDHTAELDALSALTSTTQGRQILTAASFDAMKTLLSLNLVENTADADKPVSSATALSILAAVSTAAADATAKANAAQAFAIQRANHTGTQLLATISDAGNAASRNVGTGSGDVAAGDAPAAAQAAAVQRSNHTGTQLLSTISDAGSAASRNVGTTSTTVAAGDAPAAAQAAAVAAASTDATTKANAAQAAAISAAASDATTKADAKVADAINDGTTTVAPSQNAVFDALSIKVPRTRTIAGIDLLDDVTVAELRAALGIREVLLADWTLPSNASLWNGPTALDLYDEVRLEVTGRTTQGSSTGAVNLRFNGNSVSGDYINGNGGSSTWLPVGSIAGSLTNTNRWGRVEAIVQNKAGTLHTVSSQYATTEANTTPPNSSHTLVAAGHFTQTAAITSLTVHPNTSTDFVAGTRFRVFGRLP